MSSAIDYREILLEESRRLDKERHISRDLSEALEQAVTSMLDSGYRKDSVVIRRAHHALKQHREARS